MKQAILFLLAAFLLSGCENQTTPTIRSIKVSGTHKETVTPDLYKYHLSIKQTAKEKEAATKALEQTRTELYSLLKSVALPDSSIKPKSISVRKQQKWDSGVQETVGFIAMQEFTIEINALHQPKELEPSALIQALHKISDLEIGFIEPSLSNPEKTKNEISAKALALAMDKAELLAESVHGKIGKPLNISEENFDAPHFNQLSLARSNRVLSPQQNTGEDFSPSIEMSSTVFLTVELKF